MKLAGSARNGKSQQAYSREFAKYLGWMTLNGHGSLWAYPGQQIMMMYLVWLVTVDLDGPKKIKPRTGYGYLQHVSASVQDFGHPCPVKMPDGRAMVLLAKVYKSLKMHYGDAVAHKLAVSTDMVRLLLLCPRFDRTAHDGRMLRAAVVLAAIMGLRVSEFVSPTKTKHSEFKTLCVRNVSFGTSRGGARYAEIRIEYAKNSLFREGFTQKVWEDGSDMCPYTALADYLGQWDGMHACMPTGGPLFRFHSGKNLIRETFTEALRAGLEFAGFEPKKYSAHSLRAGAAVSVSAAGYGSDVIKAQGRWFSSAYEVYMGYTDEFLREVQIKMTEATSARRMEVIGCSDTAGWDGAPWQPGLMANGTVDEGLGWNSTGCPTEPCGSVSAGAGIGLAAQLGVPMPAHGFPGAL
jgi:hypothetical protein